MTALPSRFRPRAAYEPVGPYRLLPFRFMRWPPEEVLVVNPVGEFLFLSRSDFNRFVEHRLVPQDPAYLDLKARHLLADSPSPVPIQMLATKYRTKLSFLTDFTALHLFVVTLRCDHSCGYCQVSRVTADRLRYDMSEETARAAVTLMFRSPARALKVEFQGGEPLLAFDRIRFVVEEVERQNQAAGRDIQFVVASNLAPLTEDMLAYFRDHAVLLSTSLDGPAFIHNANRPRPGGDSYEITLRNLALARETLGQDRVSALMTTTALSLGYPTEIVDEYVARGFGSIFLRSVSPYGFAVRSGAARRTSADAFLAFYGAGLDRVIDWNRRGRPMVETYAEIILRKILTPFPTGYVDLRSPAGAVIGAVAYNYDGDVYASDEARMLAAMGDQSFRLGNVHRNSFEEIFGGPVARGCVAASVHETLPGCSECAFAPYCGADPVFHWATQGDPLGHGPTSAFCEKQMGVIRHLFDLLRSGDPFIRRLFAAWASGAEAVAGQEKVMPA